MAESNSLENLVDEVVGKGDLRGMETVNHGFRRRGIGDYVKNGRYMIRIASISISSNIKVLNEGRKVESWKQTMVL